MNLSRDYTYRLPNGQTRVNMRALLADPDARRELAVRFIVSAQAMEGIETTEEQAEAAYDRVQREERGHR